jgi:serine/threonine protein kinase/O-acetyl-ADP-ribose deacetylase (regulator of RNase III)
MSADSWPLSLEKRVDEACGRFEAAWRAGEKPRIEDYLANTAEPEYSELLRQLLALEIELRCTKGDKPAPEEYEGRFPKHGEVIEAVFAEGLSFGRRNQPSPNSQLQETTAPFKPGTPPTGAIPSASKYEILAEVGRGGMGIVYRARHRILDKQVAIKVVLPGRSPERFQREAKLLAKISSPFVLTVHDFEILADGSPMLCMEWVEGTNLLEVIRAEGKPLPEEQTLRWMRETCAGMWAAAEQGITHRDLKPSNILIDSRGRARIADFGLARDRTTLTDLSRSSEVLGTPYYMAPEQAEDPHSADTRADIYSFGATFYHALTGQPPFDGATAFAVLYKHKTEPLISPIGRNPQISERTSELLERCLAKSPAARFQTFAEILGQLEPTPTAAFPWDVSEDVELAGYLSRYRERRAVYVQLLTVPLAKSLYRDRPFREVDEYRFPGGRTLRVAQGDIVDQDVDAIVSSADSYLSMNAGVQKAIREAAGSRVHEEAGRYVPVRPGRAVVTSGGKLKARFIFHGATLGFFQGQIRLPSRDYISEIMASCFYHADTLDVRTIAFPLLGTGGGGFSKEVCLDTMFLFLARMLLRGLTCVDEARIVLFG